MRIILNTATAARRPIAARQPSPGPLCPWQRVRMVELATRYRYDAFAFYKVLFQSAESQSAGKSAELGS
jgi:hypothetical protein